MAGFVTQSEYISLPICNNHRDTPVIGRVSVSLLGWTRAQFLTGCCCSVVKSCPTLCDLMDCSMPAFPGLCYLSELAQIHVHWVSDDIQSSYPLSPPSPHALNLSQHQGLFQWVWSSHQVAKVLEHQLQQQSFQWTFRVDSFRIDWFDLLQSKGSWMDTFEEIKTLIENSVSSLL